MHRLRRALERVSFDQTLGGRLDESDGETMPPSGGTLSCRSLADSSKLKNPQNQAKVRQVSVVSANSEVSPSDGLIFPASPMDWDNFTDPEYLFTAAPPEDPPPGQCRSLIHGLLSGRPVSWEATVDVADLWDTENTETQACKEGVGSGGGRKGGELWEEIIHQLTARSVIRDFEKMAEKEGDASHGKVSSSR